MTDRTRPPIPARSLESLVAGSPYADRAKKNDCEREVVKRLLDTIATAFPNRRFLIAEDGPAVVVASATRNIAASSRRLSASNIDSQALTGLRTLRSYPRRWARMPSTTARADP